MIDRSLARKFDALGDPMRRVIFERLSRRPMPVGELAKGLPVSRPAVSQHLKVLKQAELVDVSVDGTRRVYHIDRAGLGPIREWLDRHWAVALDAFRQAVEAEEDE
jgi:DNA-binding transcriptional ArsR family regulator